MAVNINTVYTTVLYILNKEQRGYIPPAEFNSLAAQVQDEIFQSYFPDGNQVNRVNQNNTQNDTEFFNMFKDISYKLYPFEKDLVFQYDSNLLGWYIQPQNVYKLGNIISGYTYNTTNTDPQAEVSPSLNSITQLVSKSDYDKITRSKLTKPTQRYPICYTTNVATSSTSLIGPPIGSLLIKVFPNPTELTINCLTQPTTPRWSFVVGPQGQYVYSGGQSIDFELDVSEKTNIITNILKYAGVVINDPTIIQVAEQEAKSVEINTKS